MTWLANILIIVGIWQLGDRKRSGFLFNIAGEAIWTAVSLYKEQYDLAAICAVFCVLATRSWLMWGRG